MPDPSAYPQSLLHYTANVFQLVKEARLGAFERQDIQFGDNAQVLGIRAYNNFADAVIKLKGTVGWEWLHAEERRGRLTLQITDEEYGQLTFRVWRAASPDTKTESKRMVLAQRPQITPDLFQTDSGLVDRWGLVYQSDADGIAVTAYLIGYDSYTQLPLVQFEVPRDKTSAGLALVTSDPAPVKVKTVKPTLKSKNPKPVINPKDE